MKGTIAEVALILTLITSMMTPITFIQSLQSTWDSWWDSNWKYRRPIIVTNPLNENLQHYNVSIVINATQFIEKGKVRSDYGDIRFTYYDTLTGEEKEITNYWMEGYADSYVSFWIQIDHIPAESNITLYMYYGNQEASYTGLIWNGTWFTYTNSSTIPDGFNESSNIYGRFPLASDSFGVLGGSPTHTHIIEGNTDVQQIYNYAGSWGVVYTCGTHSHHFRTITDPAPNYPPYYTLKLLNRSGSIYLLKDFIIYTNSSFATNSSYYEIFKPAIGYFLLPNETIGKIGGTSPHVHTFSGKTDIARGGGPYMLSGVDVTGDHYHIFSGTTKESIIMPRYYNLTPIYVKENLAPLEAGITLMANSVPPIGWKPLIVSDKFIRCSTIPGGQGGGHHYHNFTFTTSTAYLLSGGDAYWSPYQGISDYHVHTATGISSQESDDPPYFSVLYIVRDEVVVTYSIGREELGPNIAITKIESLKSIVGYGYTTDIIVEIANFGSFTEIFNLTIYINMTPICKREIMLQNESSITISVTWNTTSFDKGNYTISAYVTPVPAEINTTDNLLTDGWVYIGIPGDVDANNFVDVMDLLAIAFAYGSTPGHPKYNPNYDIDGNNFIDVMDLLITAMNYGKTDPR